MKRNRKKLDIVKIDVPLDEWPIEMVETLLRDSERKFKKTGRNQYLVTQRAAERIYAASVTSKLEE